MFNLLFRRRKGFFFHRILTAPFCIAESTAQIALYHAIFSSIMSPPVISTVSWCNHKLLALFPFRFGRCFAAFDIPHQWRRQLDLPVPLGVPALIVAHNLDTNARSSWRFLPCATCHYRLAQQCRQFALSFESLVWSNRFWSIVGFPVVLAIYFSPLFLESCCLCKLVLAPFYTV